MNSIELIDKKELLRVQADAIVSGAEKESRMLNNEETDKFNDIVKQIEDIDKELRDINTQLNNNKDNNTMEKFSLIQSINDVVNNKQLNERAKEVVEAGMAEMRKSGQSYSGQIVLPMEYRADI